MWLRADLRAFGADAGFSVPLCPSLPRIDSRARRLGVRYVIEGAALGGQQLARRLDTLLGTGVEAGRRFFIGRGTATGAAWRAFLAELAACEADSTPRDAVITGACETFALFEWWLSGSSDHSAHGHAARP